MQVLQVLVQLPDLWTQGAIHQHVNLPTLCHPFALRFRKGWKTNKTGSLRAARFVFGLFVLPHGKAA